MASKLEERVLTHRGRQHFRRTYSRVEARYSVAVFLGLGLVAAWIAWKGAHPDPSLFEAPIDPGVLAPAAVTVATERGPLPAALAPAGFAEEQLGTFDATNLYVKINGREGYFKSFGFQRLWALSLVAKEDPTRVIDLEVYDLGLPENARGALSGELPEGAEPRQLGGDLAHQARNALLLTRGQHFVRAIGSDEGPEVKAALTVLEEAFVAGISGAERPWTEDLFTELGVAPADISYFPENAFSFGFARKIHAARLAGGDTEVFLHAAADEATATALAGRFATGFLHYGEAIEGSEVETPWVKDRYLGEVSGAVAEGSFVLGVRTAPDLETAETTLASLRAAVAKHSPVETTEE